MTVHPLHPHHEPKIRSCARKKEKRDLPQAHSSKNVPNWSTDLSWFRVLHVWSPASRDEAALQRKLAGFSWFPISRFKNNMKYVDDIFKYICALNKICQSHCKNNAMQFLSHSVVCSYQQQLFGNIGVIWGGMGYAYPHFLEWGTVPPTFYELSQLWDDYSASQILF